MPITTETIALVAATYLFAGIVKGVTGLGVPIIGVAFTAPVIGMQAAVALVLGPSVLTNIWQALVGGNILPILRRIWPLLLTSCIGVWFGSGILAAADGRGRQAQRPHGCHSAPSAGSRIPHVPTQFRTLAAS